MPFFVEHGLSQIFYWGCYLIGFVVLFIFNGFYAKHYGISTKKAVAFSISSYAIIYLWAFVLAWIINGFQWGHHNAIRVYIWMPLVLFLLGKAFRIDFPTACDYIAPGTVLVYAIARLGCNFAGCCYGISCSFGIESVLSEENPCFPVQLCQTLCSLIIFFVLLKVAKKKNYEVTNHLYPLMLILYGSARFGLDFLQVEHIVLFGNFSELAIWGLLCVVMGVVWLVLLNKQSSRKIQPRSL